MSEHPVERALGLLRQATAEALSLARSGQADAEALEALVSQRAELIAACGTLEGPTTARMRALAHEITQLDRTLIAWCEQSQRALARKMVRRGRRAIEYRSPSPSIISQEA